MTSLSPSTVAALRSALGAEHAAVWVYGLADAYCTDPRVVTAINQAMLEHTGNRGAAELALQNAGVLPPPTEAAYTPPHPIIDQTSAIQALIAAETDCQVGWRSVMEATEDTGIRRTGLSALTTSAVRATRWRITIGVQPSAQAFPGQP
jgi:hypothetical protein